MKVACLISGGKDSWYSAYLASQKNEIKCLIAVKSDNKESYMYHVPNIDLVEKQAECSGFELIKMPSSGVKEEELEDLKQGIELAKVRFKIEGVVVGALKSKYQKERVEKICNDLGLEIIAPLWQKDEDYYMHELILGRFDVVIVGVGAEGFSAEWLGRKIDAKALQELRERNKKFGVSLAGEGGEYESIVLDCPLFKKRLKIIDSEKKMDDEYSGYLKINNVDLVEK